MPIINKMPGVPTTGNTKAYRFQVIAEVTGSCNEKALRVVHRCNDIHAALIVANEQARTSKYVEISNPNLHWVHIVRAL